MPEFNRNFAQGKMNKDLDERLVPAGQYRDAMNIQVSTSDGSNVGSLENILGNVELSTNLIPEGGYCVGSIVDNEVNCIYYLVAGNEFVHSSGNKVTKNYIVKYDIDADNFTFVFVDIYRVHTEIIDSGILPGLIPLPFVKVSSLYGIRKNMTFNGDYVVDFINTTTNEIAHNNVLSPNVFNNDYIFSKESVLGFNKRVDITAINIVGDLLMYTDDQGEPRTVNIKRSILGTGSDDDVLNTAGANNSSEYHTRLVSTRKDGGFADDGLEIVTNFTLLDVDRPVYSELENNTTIRKSPLTPPTLKMSSTSDNRPLRVDSPFNPTPEVVTPGGGASVNLNNPFLTLIGPFGQGSTQFPTAVVNTGTTVQIQLDFNVSFEPGDFILITSDTSQNPLAFTDFDIRAQVLSGSGDTYTIQITSINPDLENVGNFFVILEQEDAMFEFKFPRFSYRYKYTDGQYSPFAPFSEIAFLPGPYDYYPKEGYNLAMTNRLRNLKVENYAPTPNNRPKDIVEIDVLYKEDKSTTVYTVKTIKPSDGPPLWPTEIPINTTSYTLAGGAPANNFLVNRGSLQIESELIHAVVPANQLLRPWDNVPRKAKAQEVSANRLIYANYLQNYDLVSKANKLIAPEVEFTFNPRSYGDLNASVNTPHKSIKSQRTYQLGVIYKDEFGRETPVLADKKGGSLTIAKEFCDDSSSFSASVLNDAPAWATSFKFFIKETSNEYYNLAMDRWYEAEDGNIWLSFNSSDRNKVDEETFLELKKAHTSDTAVEQPARYKIIAIENEAPQDIKLDRDIQGVLTNSAFGGVLNNQIGDTANPVQEGLSHCIIRSAAFDAAFQTQATNPASVLTRASECSIRFQTITGARSKFYKILSISQGNHFGINNTDGYRITIEGTFDSDVETVYGPNFVNRNNGIQVVISHDEFEDKPEFDGKFFVKIFRDAIVEQFIMVTSDEDLIPVRSFNFRYLHTYDLHTGGSGSLRNTENDLSGIGGVLGNVRNDYIRSIAGRNHKHPYNSGYTWGDNDDVDPAFGALPGGNINTSLLNVSNQDNSSGGPDGVDGGPLSSNIGNIADGFGGNYGGEWGIYKGTWANGNAATDPNDNIFDSLAAQILLAPFLLLANGLLSLASNNQARAFWNDYFCRNGATAFIDDAWAVSWAVLPDTRAAGISGDNTDYHTAPGQIVTNTAGADLECTQWNSNANSANTVNHTAPGYPQAPNWVINGSRGIYGSQMDISIVGGFLGPDTETQYGGGGLNWQDELNAGRYLSFMDPGYLTHQTGAYDNLIEFMNLLITPGCKWRWREDPDQTVCETVDHYKHFGIINAQKTDFAGDVDYWYSWNRREKYTIRANQTIYNARRNAPHDGTGGTVLDILGPIPGADAQPTDNPAVWETKPKEDVGLDIYYEISRAYPVEVISENTETLLIPGYSDLISVAGVAEPTINRVTIVSAIESESAVKIELENNITASIGDVLLFNDGYGGTITLAVVEDCVNQDFVFVNNRFHSSFTQMSLPWHNCYVFGNGVESDRIRDDFNQPQIANGVKASTTIAEQYKEERRSQSFIFSGIFNSLSGVNRLNQFIQAEPITKDLDPDNGSIQKLFTRDTDIVTFCEDKVLKVLSDKDALFESGGNAQLTAANKVLGQAIAFAGDYGISKNPESFAADKYRCYFTDTQRGAVLRLSKDGMTPISDYGMKDYFTDTFNTIKNFRLIGTFDQRKDNYNLTMYEKPTVRKGFPNGFLASNFPATTVTYNEQVKGWTSFKSFHPETGVGVNNDYYTFSNGSIWKHHINNSRNSFYGNSFVPSHVEVLFNDAPSSVKNFQTIKYEGTQARINKHVGDNQYYNLNTKEGWYVEYANTDLQDGKVPEFLNKEGKWFNYIKGACTDFNNLDEQEFTVQGIGEATITHSNPGETAPVPVRAVVKDSSQSTSGQIWD